MGFSRLAVAAVEEMIVDPHDADVDYEAAGDTGD